MICLELAPGTRSLRVEVIADWIRILGTFYVPLPPELCRQMQVGHYYPGHTFADGYKTTPGLIPWQRIDAHVRAEAAEHVAPTTTPEGP